MVTAPGDAYSSRAITRLPDQRLLISSYSGYLVQAPGQLGPFLCRLGKKPVRQTDWLIINDLVALSATQLLAAEENSFYLLNAKNWRRRPLTVASQPATPLRATVLARGAAGRVWAGTQAGLYWVSAVEPWLHPYLSLLPGQFLPDIRAMQYDAAGYLWLATTEGLYRLHVATGRLRHFALGRSAARFLPTHELLSLALAGSRVWLGTRDQGLLLIDPDRGVLRHLTAATGLPSNTVCSLLPDNLGALWLGTYDGVVRYQPATGQLSIFTTADGLADNECNYQSAYRDAAGVLYFGSVRGVTRINPHQLPNQFSAHRRLVFTRIARYPGQDTTTEERFPAQRNAGRLVLTDRDEATVKVALTDYLSPHDTRYYYRLVGLPDTVWHLLDPIRTVRLLFLPVGTYQLVIKAESAARGPAANQLFLPLEVRRSWWKYPAVQYGAALLLLAGAVGYVRRSRWVRRQQQLVLRRRLAHDLHDELGSLLVRASLQAQLLKAEPQLLEPAANYLIQELRSASQAMRDIVWSIDTYSNTLGDLLDRMREHMAQLPPAAILRATFETASIREEQVVDQYLRQHVYFIFKEAVTNSLRHAQQSSMLAVNLTQQGQRLVLRVTDNGQPVPIKSRLGVGRRSMQQRACALDGSLQADWLASGGYEVLLIVPLRG